jgi:tyrosyl-tRNA synthetase
MAEIRGWKSEVDGGRNPRDVKVLLALEIVERFHDRAAAGRALADFEARFRQGAVPQEMPEFTLASGGEGISIPQAMKQTGLASSTSEAMRAIDQGGVRIDGERVRDKSLRLMPGTAVVLQVGKRKFARLSVTTA